MAGIHVRVDARGGAAAKPATVNELFCNPFFCTYEITPVLCDGLRAALGNFPSGTNHNRVEKGRTRALQNADDYRLDNPLSVRGNKEHSEAADTAYFSRWVNAGIEALGRDSFERARTCFTEPYACSPKISWRRNCIITSGCCVKTGARPLSFAPL